MCGDIVCIDLESIFPAPPFFTPFCPYNMSAFPPSNLAILFNQQVYLNTVFALYWKIVDKMFVRDMLPPYY